MRALQLVTGLALTVALVGCSSDDGKKADEGPEAKTQAAKPATPEIVRSGFGQSGQYVQAIVVLKNSDEASVGEFAEVSVNFKDASGELVATETQTETFSWVGQELVLPVWLDLADQPKVDIASIEPTVTISDYGSSADAAQPLDAVEASDIREKYGTPTAKFVLKNTTSEPMKDLRVGVVCENAAGEIVGGSSEYPELVPPNGEIVADVSVTVSSMPSRCTAFPNYGDL